MATLKLVKESFINRLNLKYRDQHIKDKINEKSAKN